MSSIVVKVIGADFSGSQRKIIKILILFYEEN